jgi:hypothetical protein
MSRQISNESKQIIIKELINMDSDIMSMAGPYESSYRQRRLTARTEGYTQKDGAKKGCMQLVLYSI